METMITKAPKAEALGVVVMRREANEVGPGGPGVSTY